MEYTKEIQELFDRIPTGHSTPLIVPNKNTRFRQMVAEANDKGDCIINVGKGYYRPVPGDPIDEKEYEHYIAKELHRAREILFKRRNMIAAFENKTYLKISGVKYE